MVPLPQFQGNSYGSMALKVRQKFPPRLALVHAWLSPVFEIADPISTAFAFKAVKTSRGFTNLKLKTGIAGVKSPQIRGGGVKILNFQGPLKLTPFYRDSIETRQFGGQKSKSSRGNFRASSPPSSVRYVLTPPIRVFGMLGRPSPSLNLGSYRVLRIREKLNGNN